MTTAPKSATRLLQSLHARLIAIDDEFSRNGLRANRAVRVSRPAAPQRRLKFTPATHGPASGGLRFTAPPREAAWFLPSATLAFEVEPGSRDVMPDGGFRLAADEMLAL